MTKIKKGLSDTDMLANFKEETTFEHSSDNDCDLVPTTRPKGASNNNQLNSSFLTPDLQEKIGRSLLELKLQLFKQGIIDYTLKVSCQNGQVVLSAVPLKQKGSK